MKAVVYTKRDKKKIRKRARFAGIGMVGVGLIFASYIIFPLISWMMYVRPVIDSQAFTSPIPKATIITKDYIESLFRNTAHAFSGVDYNNAQNWVPSTYKEAQVQLQVASYSFSVPKLGIENATVSTTDTDLGQHLVQFPGTAVPPAVGNAVIFGHSTIPQWFDPKNYHAIFATALNLQVGDAILIGVNNTLYTYKIVNIRIVEPTDTSYLTQDSDGSYLTIVTCTPPGTTWERLIIKAKLDTM
jgi:sortase A